MTIFLGYRCLSISFVVTGLLASLSVPVAAMQILSEDELAFVSGQDGLVAEISAPQISLAQWATEADVGVAGMEGGISAEGLVLNPLGQPELSGQWELDAGSDVNGPLLRWTSHIDRFRLGGNYDALTPSANTGWSARVAGDSQRSFGEWALVSDLDFHLIGRPLFGTPATTHLNLALNDATLFYRQNPGHAAIALNKLHFLWDMPAGTVDIDNQGLRLAGNTTFRIGFDWLYKSHVDQNMTSITANDRPIVRFGWGGTLYDSLLYMRGGGVWDTSSDAGTNVAFNPDGSLANMPAGASQGISYGMRWNYHDGSGNHDFLWSIGHVTGDREYLEFGDWKNLEQATGPVAGRYGFDFPLIMIDALDAGSASNAGGSLCWGASMIGAACNGAGSLLTLEAGRVTGYSSEVNRNGGALVMQLIRNGNLLAWSNQVRVMRHPLADANPTLEGDYQWGLIYTMANINGNVYFYPGGSESDTAGGSRSHGVLADVLFMTQSFGNWAPDNVTNSTRWSQGSHFMIADTGAQQGIGLLGASYLVGADDLRLWLKNTSAGEASPNNWRGGVDLFSPRTRAQLKAVFGGARLPNGHDLVRVANVDFNLEGLWNFRLSPPPTNVQSGKSAESNDFLAYSVAMRLRCGSTVPFGCTDNAFSDAPGSSIASGVGSYISFEEPGRPGADLRFADLSGDVAWTEGVLQLRSSNDTAADTAPGSANKLITVPPRSDLSLSNKLLLGASATTRMNDAATGAGLGSGGAAGRAFTTNVMFGGNHVYSWAIPASSMYSSFTLRPQ